MSSDQLALDLPVVVAVDAVVDKAFVPVVGRLEIPKSRFIGENSRNDLPLVVADVFDGIDRALRVPHRLPVYRQSLVGAVHQAKRNKDGNVHFLRTLLIWACCEPRFCVKLCDLG